MKLVENQVIRQLMNRKEVIEYHGVMLETGRMLPGTIIVLAKVLTRSRGFAVRFLRDAVGNEIKPETKKFDSEEEAYQFLEVVYGV